MRRLRQIIYHEMYYNCLSEQNAIKKKTNTKFKLLELVLENEVNHSATSSDMFNKQIWY